MYSRLPKLVFDQHPPRLINGSTSISVLGVQPHVEYRRVGSAQSTDRQGDYFSPAMQIGFHKRRCSMGPACGVEANWNRPASETGESM